MGRKYFQNIYLIYYLYPEYILKITEFNNKTTQFLKEPKDLKRYFTKEKSQMTNQAHEKVINVITH